MLADLQREKDEVKHKCSLCSASAKKVMILQHAKKDLKSVTLVIVPTDLLFHSLSKQKRGSLGSKCMALENLALNF